jgi:glutathione S-transferase
MITRAADRAFWLRSRPARPRRRPKSAFPPDFGHGSVWITVRSRGGRALEKISFSDPLLKVYAIAASIMILKAVMMSWLTVYRMMKVNGGFRSPEDVKKTLLNPNPSEGQLAPNEYVDRIRRIQLNDLENLPFFLIAGLLFILTKPPVLLAQALFYGYVLSRLIHFVAYFTARTHDSRATLWTIGSLILIVMTIWALVSALNS